MSKEKDYFWDAQGKTAFVKAKSDWLNIGKLHLSFVKHKGQPGCVQEFAIEGCLDFFKENSAHYFSELILSGAASRMARESKANQAAAGAQYAEPIFKSQGGSAAKAEKNRPCYYRELTLSPGETADYVLAIMQCEGEPTDRDGFMPKKGAMPSRITIGVSAKNLCQLASKIQSEYTAFRVVDAMKNGFSQWDGSGHNQSAALVMDETGQPSASAPFVAIIYDTSGLTNSGVPRIKAAHSAVYALQQSILELKNHPNCLVKTDAGESYQTAVQMIESATPGVAVIPVVGKTNPAAVSNLIVVTDFLL